jgi:hypothetical protein
MDGAALFGEETDPARGSHRIWKISMLLFTFGFDGRCVHCGFAADFLDSGTLTLFYTGRPLFVSRLI